MAQINRNNLGFLGESFQYRLAHEFMESHSFFEDLSGIVDQNMFTDPNLKTFVGVLKNYYEREDRVPSYDNMEVELRNISHTDREMETYVAVVNKVKNTPSDGVDRTKELAEKFFRQQNIIKSANEILRIAGSGDMSKYEQCVDLMNDAMTKGMHNDFGETVFDHLNETLSNDYRVPIPTGIPKIDEVLEGGLGKGELGVIIGPTSFGKVQPNDSKIATPSGFKNMGDIKVGDYVIGQNGKPTKVIGVYPHKNWQFYKVTFSDGVYTECGKEHLWAVSPLYDRRKKKDFSYKVMSLEEIMSKELHIGSRHNFKIPMADPVEFEDKEIEIEPYDYGFGLANNNGDEDRFIHHDYLYNSIEKRIELLNGIMDCKGTCMGSGRCYFRTNSKRLAEDVMTLVLSLCGFAKLTEHKRSYELEIRMQYPSIPLFKDKEKQDNVKYVLLNARYIESIEKSRVCDGQCIKVEADDELYLTDYFIVTHNTSLTTAMASHAACNGFKVLQIVFEDRIKQIQRKHIGRITGVESKDLSKPQYIDKVRAAIEAFPDKEKLNENLRIVKFPSGEKTAKFIENFIKKLTNNGFKPDLVIVDYFECLKHDDNRETTNDFEREGKTMRKFEAMVGELNIAMWIPSQGTKDSINLDLVTMDKIGGSVKKAQIAHVIMSIARSVDDISNNKATIAILKNRAGGSGQVYNNVDFNNGTCRISTDNAEEHDSLFDAKERQREVRDEMARECFLLSKKDSKQA